MDVEELLKDLDGALNEQEGDIANSDKEKQGSESFTRDSKIGVSSTAQPSQSLGQDTFLPNISAKSSSGTDDIDQLLNEIDSVDTSDVTDSKMGIPTMGLGVSTTSQKCNPTKLGPGAVRPNGSMCSTLRCTSCDFEVLRFPGQRWSDKVNYMFFRNNTPNKVRLSINLKDDSTCAAYCCQCSWASLDKMVSLGGPPLLEKRWTCGGH
eukprot:CAMPEP_0184493928 /NCGR_PEP_ID=MMETSP0113_2-20130426/27337_1 /TAXON_ID=91329 /ORGANISM="Norrisiella sphaerica, Strain BC52" /LENGTH=207 /DNA_ID=CAMNT_0026879419 /DNA_START=261 /DNA_END=884 /DNA_ORIENTATION=+